MSWLVTGAAGYIGAHVVDRLRKDGVEIVALDDLSTGLRTRLPDDLSLEQCSILDGDALSRVFSGNEITGVVHLAAKKQVDESLERPSFYFHENVEGLRRLLDCCVHFGVRRFLFSSSAAVYGAGNGEAIDEATHSDPATPYGQSKLAGEWLTHAIGRAEGMHTIALRYFNVAGCSTPSLADLHGLNLVPRILRAVNAGESPRIFGDDYPTPDGTAVRDYVHVVDVADAHVAAVRALEEDRVSGESINIGTGRGTSVREMVDTALRVTNSELKPVVEPRRVGDAPAAVASVDRAADVLQWKSAFDVSHMIESAWEAQTLADQETTSASK